MQFDPFQIYDPVARLEKEIDDLQKNIAHINEQVYNIRHKLAKFKWQDDKKHEKNSNNQ